MVKWLQQRQKHTGTLDMFEACSSIHKDSTSGGFSHTMFRAVHLTRAQSCSQKQFYHYRLMLCVEGTQRWVVFVCVCVPCFCAVEITSSDGEETQTQTASSGSKTTVPGTNMHIQHKELCFGLHVVIRLQTNSRPEII